MSARAATLAVLVAACGSAAPAPRPLEAGPSPDPIERKARLIEDAAERACACSDVVCEQQLDLQLATALAAVPAERMFENEAVFARVDAAMDRAVRCMWSHGVVPFGFESVAVEAAGGMRAKSCACTDQACTMAFDPADFTRVLRLVAAPYHEDKDDPIEQDVKAAMKCVTRDQPQAAPSTEGATEEAEQAIVELDKLRARNCACETLQCRHDVQAELLAWGHANEKTATSAEQAARMKAIGASLRECSEAKEAQP